MASGPRLPLDELPSLPRRHGLHGLLHSGRLGRIRGLGLGLGVGSLCGGKGSCLGLNGLLELLGRGLLAGRGRRPAARGNSSQVVLNLLLERS